MYAWVGDEPGGLELHLYSDANFADEQANMKSTSGVFLCLKGEYSFVPLSGLSKRQTCVSHSTPEAEIVAADCAVRTEGLPALPLWEEILGRFVVVLPGGPCRSHSGDYNW